MAFNPAVLPADWRSNNWDKFTPEQKDKWLALRDKGLTDAFFLANDLLGMDFQQNPHAGLFKEFLPKSPGKALYDLDTEIKKRMILWPRGTFKTSAIIVEIVQLILNYPDIRICFLSGSMKLSKRQLARIKRVFERPTEAFANLFPEFCGKDLGTTEEFNVPCQSASRHFAEPTFAISTAGSVKSGAHFDVIFIDDLVNDQNYKSVAMLEKCIEDYKDIGPLLAPSGFLYVTGTRYSFGDAYEYIQEKAKEEMKETGETVWKFSIRTCWVKYCKTCGHPDINHDSDKNYQKPPCTICKCKCFVDSGKKDVLFPQFRKKDGGTEGHTIKFLESERREKGEEFFACQYENNPIASGTQTFTPELIDRQTLYHLKQIPEHGPVFIVGDLSYAGNDKRDETVFYICRLHEGQIFAFDCIHGKWRAEELAIELIQMVYKYRPRVIFIEAFLGHDAYNTVFQIYASNSGIQRLPIEWVKMSNVEGAKKLRIGAIQGVLAARRLWLFAGMQEFELLCKQLKRFPKLGKHDDFADCLGLVCEVPTGYAMTKLPDQNPSYNWFKEKEPDLENAAYADNGCGSGILC